MKCKKTIICVPKCQGPEGPIGPRGPRGIKGSMGPQGTRGSMGPQGTRGSMGLQGSRGSMGLQGSRGSMGLQGSRGSMGLQGSRGSMGLQGSRGSMGLPGGLLDAAYIWRYSNTTNPIPSGGVPSSAIPFSPAGTFLNGNFISHTAGAATIGVSAGTYEVNYYIARNTASQNGGMALFTGTSATPIPETVYGKGVNDKHNYGQAIFTTSATSLTLKNVGSQALALDPNSDSVSASIVIKKLA